MSIESRPVVPVHISYSTCPECMAEFVEFGRETGPDGKVTRHVNGGTWEYIRFACGRKDGYIPNFLKIETEYPCRFSPEERAKSDKRRQARKVMSETLKALDVDEYCRIELARGLGGQL